MRGKWKKEVDQVKKKAFCFFFIALFSSVYFLHTAGESFLLPQSLSAIEEDAFSGCASMREIFLPEGVQSIDPSAFDNTGETLWVHCYPGEAAQNLLLAGVDIDANTVSRALIICQSYTGTSLALQGPPNDARAMQFCLSSLSRQNYQITQKTNLNASGMKEEILSAFSEATAYDISLLFYTGHGREGGALYGVDGSLLTPQELRNTLDRIPGRKVVIIDACFSGGVLEADGLSGDDGGLLKSQNRDASKAQASDVSAFNAAFLSAFSNEKTRGEAAGGYSQYYVMASARYDEYCQEGLIKSGSSSKVMGYFSFCLCKGCGWDGVSSAAVNQFADSNADGVVSFGEAFAYAAREAKLFNAQQDAQSNMSGCDAFSPFR